MSLYGNDRVVVTVSHEYHVQGSKNLEGFNQKGNKVKYNAIIWVFRKIDGKWIVTTAYPINYEEGTWKPFK